MFEILVIYETKHTNFELTKGLTEHFQGRRIFIMDSLIFSFISLVHVKHHKLPNKIDQWTNE